MLSAPAELSEEVLLTTLARGWDLRVASMVYRPLGFGSHHWEVVDTDGVRWFVTVDDLEMKAHAPDEPLQAAYDRLRGSLATATDLHGHGYSFVVAPIRARDGEPLTAVSERFAAAVYPFVNGQSFPWGKSMSPLDRKAVLDLVIALHTAPLAHVPNALADDFVIPHRGELEAALRSADDAPDCGPYALPAAKLLISNALALGDRLTHYDELVVEARAATARTVLTHGEPHPGNTMLTSGGWKLIDWDTVLIGPPERDLWGLDPGDGSILRDYARTTGVEPSPSMLELYRVRWDLSDIAVEVTRFRRLHTGTLDDEKAWNLLDSLVTSIGTG